MDKNIKNATNYKLIALNAILLQYGCFTYKIVKPKILQKQSKCKMFHYFEIPPILIIYNIKTVNKVIKY